MIDSRAIAFQAMPWGWRAWVLAMAPTASTWSGYRIDHSNACIPPSEPPATAASRSIPIASRNARSVRTMSATVMTGKSGPYGWPVAGSGDDGPVVPRQPPSRLVATTKKLSVSNALPGPIIPSHQPSPLPAAPSRASAANPSRVLSPVGVLAKPAAWASPLSAWHTRMTLSRCGERVPYVSYATRTGNSSRPQSSRTGSGRSRYCVSTVPTEPAATVEAGSAMGAMVARPGQCIVNHRHREITGRRSKGAYRDMTTVTNGVNVQALLDAREVLKGAPEAAQFTWRATAKWQGGVHSTMKVQSYFGLGEEQNHKEEWSFEADHPEVFAAEDQGITPIEYLLVGLASCLTGGIASVAENRGIQLRSVESTVEGGHDIRGILGADSDVRNGYNDIKVTFTIDADASRQEIEALVAQSQKRSAVFDALTNPTNVVVEVA